LGIPIAGPPKRFIGPLQVVPPLRRLTPTGLEAFEHCRLRAVWSAARQDALLPSSPAARLGSVVHRLLEEAGRGSISAEETAIENRWADLIAEAEREMSERDLERQFAPLSHHVPQFDVVRIRALMRASELARDVPGAEARASDASDSLYGSELRVESSDGLIAGRIDRVLPTASGAVIRDYKSGAIFSLHHGDEREVRPEYVIQLRVYAALYHEATGNWPAKLELVPLSGAPHEVSYSHEESLKLLDRARSLLHEVNAELVRHGGDWDAVERALATPSASACRFCAYRPACSVYLARHEVDSDGDWPADMWGTFRGLEGLGNGRLLLSVVRGDGSIGYVRDLRAEVAEAPRLTAIREGSWIGVFNTRRTRSPRAFEEGPLTWVYTVATA
jgi:hypothetical protein